MAGQSLLYPLIPMIVEGQGIIGKSAPPR